MISPLLGKWAEPTIRYCESNLSGLIAQPANAVSSLLISLAGIYILLKKRHKYSLFLGTIAVVLGLASFAYYASFTFAGQLADLGLMFLLAALIVIAALRKHSFSTRLSIAILSILAGVPLLLTVIFKTVNGFNIGIPLFGLLLVIGLALEINQSKQDKFNLKYFVLTFFAFSLGFIFWWLDYKKIWCDPNNAHFINGHGIWHFFNALALLSLNKYYQQI